MNSKSQHVMFCACAFTCEHLVGVCGAQIQSKDSGDAGTVQTLNKERREKKILTWEQLIYHTTNGMQIKICYSVST